MKTTSPMICVLLLAMLLAVGCAQPASPPPATSAPPAAAKAAEPTKAAAPTKAAEPTKAAPAPAAPTAAPAPKVDWPAKGRTITWIIPYSAGGATDVLVRLLAPLMEKDLGAPIQLVNRTGAGAQTGVAELAVAKPDGYTIGLTHLPSIPLIYLDKERGASFSRKDFQVVAPYVVDPMSLTVLKSSPYQTAKDLVDAAKANPGKIKGGCGGFLNINHLAWIQLQKLTGTKIAVVNFEGDAPHRTALLGGHIDAALTGVGGIGPVVKSGEARMLGVFDSQESKFAPGVKTMAAQGYNINASTTHTMSVPAGTPKEIVALLAAALKKALDNPDVKAKMDSFSLSPRFMEGAQAEAYWTEAEEQVKPLIELAYAEQKQK